MNKHFEDTRYYLKRAAETAKRGVTEEIEPVRERVREVTGQEEEEVEPSRVDELRNELEELEEKAEGEAKSAIGDAREKLKAYRES
jgi:gas vesicle protein